MSRKNAPKLWPPLPAQVCRRTVRTRAEAITRQADREANTTDQQHGRPGDQGPNQVGGSQATRQRDRCTELAKKLLDRQSVEDASDAASLCLEPALDGDEEARQLLLTAIEALTVAPSRRAGTSHRDWLGKRLTWHAWKSHTPAAGTFAEPLEDAPSEAAEVPRVRLCAPPPPARDNADQKRLDRLKPLWDEGVRLLPGPDPRKLCDQLRREMPNLSAAIDILENELVLRQRCGTAEFGFPHLCLVGPPGSGKTRFASRMNALAEVPYLEHSAAGSSDSRTVLGTSRGWGTGMPALATSAVARFDAANCSLCIDDISWTALRGQNGSIQDALLTFLEPETSRRYYDEYLQTEVDLSRISWCVMANSLGQVSSALRSRLLIIEVEPPRPEDFDAILSGIVADLEREFDSRLPVVLSDAETLILRTAFQDHRSIRVLKRQLRWVIGIKVSEVTLH